MNIYKITVHEAAYVEYEIEANSEEEARDLLGMGDQQVANSHIVYWDILEIKEHKS